MTASPSEVVFRWLPRGERCSAQRVLLAVPGKGEPRALIDESALSAASELLQPTAWRNRWAWRVWRGGARLLGSRLLRRVALQAGQAVRLHPAFSTGDAVSFLVGTAGAERKVVAQRARRSTLDFVKFGDDAPSSRLIANEVRMLTSLRKEARGLGPDLLGHGVWCGTMWIQTGPVIGKNVGTRFTAVHRRFLERMRVERVARSIADSGVIRRIETAAERDARFRRIWTMVAGLVLSLRLARAVVHGDFVPWNLRESAGELAALDWEYGEPDGVEGVDAVHFLLNVGMLVLGRRGRELLQTTRALVRDGDAALDWCVEGSADARRALLLVTLLFDTATGIIATDGTLSTLNSAKLWLAEELARDARATT